MAFDVTPSPLRGEGRGEGAQRLGFFLNLAHPHPTSPGGHSPQGLVSLSLKGEGLGVQG
ncbi:hypothetical protein HNQ99_001826 [Rhizorhapis suberifaciens]|uniref:Uncharacterized protein n=1 Tax=Rhizorhapis suberifaciens TaxID=13656 RepID=A0A840HV88_9SPHN|nr:hypothetical protein [Rhizorhapis suberifaciens]